jgi:hypothetical protein
MPKATTPNVGFLEQLGRTLYVIIFSLVVFSGLYFSFVYCNKPAIMYKNYLDHTPYKIFPYSKPKDQQTSKSHPLWLFVHVLDAYFHVVLTGLVYFFDRRGEYTNWFRFSHYLFISLIAVNLQHAGDFPSWDWHALAFNGAPWLLSIMTFDPNNKIWWKSLLYLIATSSAILFETGMYLTH